MNKFKVGLAVVAAGLGIASFGATEAGATGCPSTYACVWDDVGYSTQGSTYNYLGSASEISQYSAHNYRNTGEQVHDNSSSLRNNGVTNSCRFWVDSGEKGASSTYAAGDGNGNLGPTFDNQYDSQKFV